MKNYTCFKAIAGLHLFCQDFLMYYRYTQKWVDLFEKDPFMIEIETAHYIKGMHNLISANFDLKNHKKFEEYLEKFEQFAETDTCYTKTIITECNFCVYPYCKAE